MRKVFLIAFALSLAMFIGVNSVEAATRYIDWDLGEDVPGNGTEENPWQTPWYADWWVEEGDVIIIRPRDDGEAYTNSSYGDCKPVLEINTANTTWISPSSLAGSYFTDQPIFSFSSDLDANPYCYCGGMTDLGCNHALEGSGRDTIYVNAPGVEINGFDVRGSVHFTPIADDSSIENCDLSGGGDYYESPSVLRVGNATNLNSTPGNFVENMTIKNNRLHDNKTARDRGEGYNALLFITAARDLNIQNNSFYNADNAGITWRGHHHSVTAYRNTFNNMPMGISGEGSDGNLWISISDNIFTNISQESIRMDDGYSIKFHINNNIFYNAGIALDWTGLGEANINVFNNIIYGESSVYSLRHLWSSFFFRYLDYNQYYSPLSTADWQIDEVSVAGDLATWQSYLIDAKAGLNNSDANSISFDPGLSEVNRGDTMTVTQTGPAPSGRGGIWPDIIGPFANGDEVIGYSNTALPEDIVVCGDDKCGLGESCDNCSSDCGECPDLVAPGRIVDLRVENTSFGSMRLAWTAPGGDGNLGMASYYEFRYSNDAINSANWDTVESSTAVPDPTTAGETQGFVLSGLFPNAVYYVAIRAYDEAGNAGEISNILSAKASDVTLYNKDYIEPTAPTELRAEVASGSVTLLWSNPEDEDFEEVKVRRKVEYTMGQNLVGITSLVYEGDDETFFDTGLTIDKRYVYDVYSVYEDKLENVGKDDPRESEPIRLTVYPDDGMIFLPDPIATTTLTELEATMTSLAGLNSPMVNKISEVEGADIFWQTDSVTLNTRQSALYDDLISEFGGELTDSESYSIAQFIAVGTVTTDSAGVGERAGVLHSYLSAYGHIPTTALHWQNVVKIANGRWPGERNEQAEQEIAENTFPDIYLRAPDLEHPNDLLAVVVMTYGLLPAVRSLESEHAAINIFDDIFGHEPDTTEEWNMMRAIAYSGAIR